MLDQIFRQAAYRTACDEDLDALVEEALLASQIDNTTMALIYTWYYLNPKSLH
jgi:hypothetical protein